MDQVDQSAVNPEWSAAVVRDEMESLDRDEEDAKARALQSQDEPGDEYRVDIERAYEDLRARNELYRSALRARLTELEAN